MNIIHASESHIPILLQYDCHISAPELKYLVSRGRILIAEEAGISRQGVHDLIKRCDKILQEYEDKLHLVAKANAAKAKVEEIHRISTDVKDSEACIKRIHELSKSLMEEL